MKSLLLLGLLAADLAGMSAAWAQPTFSINFARPNTANVADSAFTVVTISSTYEIQSVSASFGGQTTNLAYSATAYLPCGYAPPQCGWEPGWTNTLSFAGLPHGNNTITVTATDALGNSGQAQMTVDHDAPPVLTALAPVIGTVARPGLAIALSGTDDDPAGCTILVEQASDYSGGPVLASGLATLNTNLSLAFSDGQTMTLMLSARDSGNQQSTTFHTIFVQASTNLVEVDRVSEGYIMDVSPDRILFQVTQRSGLLLSDRDPIGPALKVKSRIDGSETTLFHEQGSVLTGNLTSQGVTYVATPAGSPYFTLFEARGGTNASLGYNYVSGQWIRLAANANFAAFGWDDDRGDAPSVYFADLQAGTSVLITNNYSQITDFHFDVSAGGDVVFTPVLYGGNHSVFLYRAGTTSLVTSDPVNTLDFPKTDGTNVYYIRTTSTNEALIMLTAGGEVKLAEGASFGSDYRLNNGWVAYTRSTTGPLQIWRGSPSGVQTQLTFFGDSSQLAALAPNGEVAFYYGGQLYISQGNPTPIDIAACSMGPSGGFPLVPFWQSGRWYAYLGRSLYQIYTGSPQMAAPRLAAGGMFGFDLVGAVGQNLVTQVSADGLNWTDLRTNSIADGAAMTMQEPLDSASHARLYRLRAQ